MGKQPKNYDIGIVFVHGIGTSRSGDTLLEWGKPLISAMGGNKADVKVALHESPAWAQFRLDGKRVKLVESAWGELFRPPGYSSFLHWSWRSIPTTIIAHFDERYRRFSQSVVQHFEDYVRDKKISLAQGKYPSFLWTAYQSQARHKHQIVVFLMELLVLFFGLVLAPLVMFLLLFLPVLSLIPAAREFAESAKESLTSYVGDSQVLTSGDLESKGILAKVRHDIETLCRQSTRCVVVAHSQGAAIAHEVLRGAKTNGSEVRFVSFGSGLRKIQELGRCAEDGRAVALAWATSGFSLAVLMLLVCVGNFAWIGPGLESIAAVIAVLSVFGYALLVNLIGLTLRMFGYSLKWNAEPGLKPAIRRYWNWIGLFVIVVIAALHRPDRIPAFATGPAWPWILTPMCMGAAFTLLMEWRYATRRASTRDEQTAYEKEQWNKRYRLNCTEWLDVYGCCDPVPNGPVLDVFTIPGYRAVSIVNKLSFVRDHTNYMHKNNPKFLSLVAEEILRDGAAKTVGHPTLHQTTLAESGYRLVALGVGVLALIAILLLDVYGWMVGLPVVELLSSTFGVLAPGLLTVGVFLLFVLVVTWVCRKIYFHKSITRALTRGSE